MRRKRKSHGVFWIVAWSIGWGLLQAGCAFMIKEKEDDEQTLRQVAKGVAVRQSYAHVEGPLVLRGGPIVKHTFDVEAGYCYRLGVAWPNAFPVYSAVLFLKDAQGKRSNAYLARYRRALLFGSDATVFCADRTGKVLVQIATMNQAQSALLNVQGSYALALAKRQELASERLLRQQAAWVQQQRAKERRAAQEGGT